MDTNVTDADDTTAQKVIGARFRAAREAAGLSRAQVERASNVSQKAIEKFEAGQQSPNFVRFAALCAAVGKSVDEMLNGRGDDDEESAIDTDAGASDRASDPVAAGLATLDDLRANRFKAAQRYGAATIEHLRSQLHYLEPDELLDLAASRGTDLSSLPTVADMRARLSATDDAEDDNQANPFQDVEERIIDTAILGADLLSLSTDDLNSIAAAVAKESDIDLPSGGWGSAPKPEATADAIREPLRRLVLAGRGYDLSDSRKYPRAA